MIKHKVTNKIDTHLVANLVHTYGAKKAPSTTTTSND